MAALTTYPDLNLMGRVSLRDRLDGLFAQHFGHEQKRIWLAKTPGGERIGLIWVQPSIHPVTDLEDFLVLNVAVLPAWRGQGVATRLLAHARAFADTRGVRRLRLFVNSDNAAAVALYRRMGFIEQTLEMRWSF